MSKKIYFQIIIFISILIITAFVYFVYFKNDDKILVKSDGGVSSNNLIKNKDDLITEMKYYSEDEKGNRYEIEVIMEKLIQISQI